MPRSASPASLSRCHANGYAGLLVSALLACGAAQAAQLELMPRLDMGALNETNPRLSRRQEDDATGIVVDGRLNFSRMTPRSRLFFNPRLRLSRYDDNNDEDLEDTDLWLTGGIDHRGSRARTQLRLGYSEVGVRTSELETAEDSPGGSGDLAFIDDTQSRWEIEPSWSYELTRTDLLNLALGYSDVSYDLASTSRFDYRYLYADTTWQHNFTPRLGVGLQLNASDFNSQNQAAKQNPLFNQGNASDNDSQTYGGSLFLSYQFSERLSGSIYGGARTTDVELQRVPFRDIFGNELCITESGIGLPPCIEKSSGNNFVSELRLARTGQRTEFDLSYSRSVTPNSNGAETLRDEFRATIRRDFSDRLSGWLGVLAYAQKDAALQTNRDRDYLSIDTNLEWLFARYWGLRGAYRFVDIKDKLSNGPDTDASNHYIFAGIFYRPRGWRW